MVAHDGRPRAARALRYGGFPENRVRFQGAVGVRREYGLAFTFVPLAAGQHYEALDRGAVDVVDGGSTDAQLADSSRYRVLADPKGIFGHQNIAPVVNRRGPPRAGCRLRADARRRHRRSSPTARCRR